MKRVYSDVLQFRGSHYEFGKFQGERLKDSITIKNRRKEWKTRRPRFKIDKNETEQVFQSFAPYIWEELIGLQDALEWSMEDVLQNFGGYRLAYVKSGCSILTRNHYMIRNYDYHPKTYDGRFVVFQPTDGGYASIAPSSRITGRMDGMNEKGLVMGYNFMHRRKPGDGFVCHMIGRIILENCATVAEGISLLKEIPHRHSFSYTLLDDNELTYIVEATPRNVAVRQANICTNHFERLTAENRHHLDDSKRRLEAIQSYEKDVKDVYEAYRMMNDTNREIFSQDYRNWAGTIHTTVYFPKEKVVWFALGDQTKPDAFNFVEWLNGRSFQTERIYGEIATDLPFAQMEVHD